MPEFLKQLLLNMTTEQRKEVEAWVNKNSIEIVGDILRVLWTLNGSKEH